MKKEHFADDTTLYRKFKTFRDNSDEVENDIELLKVWLIVNRLMSVVSKPNS